MIDKDETFAYSRVREVNFGGLLTQVHVFPNPVSDKLYVKDTGKVATLEIIDMWGRSVIRLFSSKNATKKFYKTRSKL